MTLKAQHSKDLPKPKNKKRRDLSLPEELLRVLPLLILILESRSSRPRQFSSRLMPTKLLYKPFRAYLLSNSENKESK